MLIIGAGLSGATIARILTDSGKDVIVYERKEVGGHCADYEIDGIMIHAHGPHIWHNSDPEVQQFIERFTEFNGYVHKCKANYNGTIYSFPPNLSTFHKIYGTNTIQEAKDVSLKKLRSILFDEYVLKLWGEKPPKWVTDRIPIRYTYNDRYFNDRWEGVPLKGYKNMIMNMLSGIDIVNETFDYSPVDISLAEAVFYSGSIDEFYGYQHGTLPYRSLIFHHERINEPDFQGVSHMSYTSKDVPYHRIVEHKHFNPINSPTTWITKEYSIEWKNGMDRYYPKFDRGLYNKYAGIPHDNIYFVGRLGQYRYLNMNVVVKLAMDAAHKFLNS